MIICDTRPRWIPSALNGRRVPGQTARSIYNRATTGHSSGERMWQFWVFALLCGLGKDWGGVHEGMLARG